MKKSSSITKKKPIVRAVLIICLSLFAFGIVMTLRQAANAAEGSELLETYREKKFKGALDEEELRVIANLQTSDSKKQKSQEAEEGF